MGQFKNQSANIAHDLKTPLTNLRLSLEKKLIVIRSARKKFKAQLFK